MRKLLKEGTALVLFLAVLLAAFIPVKAAKEEYTYTVRFFSGAQGTINGQELVECTGLHYGDRVTFNQGIVQVKDNGKYYIKGIRESGRDNNTVNNTASFPVTGDMDYVVVYGILGNAVAYTVNYQDTDGNALAESETYYGNIGDTPVIAFLYIDGYQPQAYNQTRTLTANAADNVFTFEYTPVNETEEPPAAAEPGTQPGAEPSVAPPAAAPTQPTVTPADVTPSAGTAGQTPGAADAAAPGAGGAGDGAAGAGEDALPDAADVVLPDDNVPTELEQLDDGETPLGNQDIGGGPRSPLPGDFASWMFRLPAAAKAGIFSAVLLAGGGGFYLVKRKKEKKTNG